MFSFVIPQLGATCIPTCAINVLRYYGKGLSLNEMALHHMMGHQVPSGFDRLRQVLPAVQGLQISKEQIEIFDFNWDRVSELNEKDTPVLNAYPVKDDEWHCVVLTECNGDEVMVYNTTPGSLYGVRMKLDAYDSLNPGHCLAILRT